MRTIKFRVWNKKTKNWVDGCGRHEIPSLDGVNLFGETILLGGFMDGVPLEDLDECVAVQFSGESDKNKKEIFEGDIVKYDFHYFNNEVFHKIEVVKFFRGSFSPLPLPPLNGEVVCQVQNYEIIGNIFENPELLKSNGN